MEPWQSWAIVGVAGAGAYWYYTRSKNTDRTRGRTPSLISQTQRRSSEVPDESNKRRGKGKNAVGSDRHTSDAADGSSQSVPPSGNERTKKRKGGNKESSRLTQRPPATPEKNPTPDVASEKPEDDGMDDRELAKQLSSLKAGTSFQKLANTTKTKKTSKQGKQNESVLDQSNGKVSEPAGGASSYELSTTSSTTGADADDDLSPATSPVFGATESTKNSGDVADMLEAPAKGPSVLRLTQPTQPEPLRQPKQKKSAPEPETKKQRQNRQKNEEKKAAREEAEKERRVLMEKQRRIAREAEGRPAKNGLGISKPPTTSPWTRPAQDSASSMEPTTINPTSNGPLLDTFDEPVQPVGNVTKTEPNGTTATQNTWDHDMPSEEEQLRMLSELNDNGWNTVQKGGKAKKKKHALTRDQVSETDGSKAETSAAEGSSNNGPNGNSKEKKVLLATNTQDSTKEPPRFPSNGVVSSKIKTTKDQVDPKIWNQSNIHNHPDYDPEYPYALTGHPDDSDWAVV